MHLFKYASKFIEAFNQLTSCANQINYKKNMETNKIQIIANQLNVSFEEAAALFANWQKVENVFALQKKQEQAIEAAEEAKRKEAYKASKNIRMTANEIMHAIEILQPNNSWARVLDSEGKCVQTEVLIQVYEGSLPLTKDIVSHMRKIVNGYIIRPSYKEVYHAFSRCVDEKSINRKKRIKEISCIIAGNDGYYDW